MLVFLNVQYLNHMQCSAVSSFLPSTLVSSFYCSCLSHWFMEQSLLLLVETVTANNKQLCCLRAKLFILYTTDYWEQSLKVL